jgi:hypothetical protein
MMAKYRKKKTVVEASQWFKNGDHPLDYAEDRPFMENGVLTSKSGEFFREKGWEGGVVRYFRHPAVDGQTECVHCGQTMHDHGWIDVPVNGHIVCPGDWIVSEGDAVYPCKPEVFEARYEAVK